MKYILSVLLSFTLIVFTDISYSKNSLRLGYLSSSFRSAFDFQNGKYCMIHGDSMMIINVDSLCIISKFKISSPDITIENKDNRTVVAYIPIYIKGRLYIINDYGGEVYKWNNGSFLRIDNSYDHKMQISSTIFEYNDMIYRYGGFGFWSCRNFFTSFNIENGSWDMVLPASSSKNPEGSMESEVHVVNSTIYLSGGYTTSLYAPSSKTIDYKLWSYNTESRKWRLLGYVNDDLFPMRFIKYRNLCVSCDDSCLIVIDFTKNRYRKYYKQEPHPIIPSCSYFYNGYFFTLSKLDIGEFEDNYILYKTKEKDFFGPFICKSCFYSSSLYYLFIPIIITPPAIIYFVRKKKKSRRRGHKISLSSKKLIYQNKNVDICSEEYCIINHLLKKNEANTSELIEVMHKEHLHISQVSRILAKSIEEINLKIKWLTGIDDEFITIDKSNFDKRIKVYSITKEFFETF